MMITYHNFQITEENGKLNFLNLKTGQVKNGIKIKHDNDFVYKCQKTQIKSMYSAAELLQEFQKAIDEKFMESMISCVAKRYIGECDYSFQME